MNVGLTHFGRIVACLFQCRTGSVGRFVLGQPVALEAPALAVQFVAERIQQDLHVWQLIVIVLIRTGQFGKIALADRRRQGIVQSERLALGIDPAEHVFLCGLIDGTDYGLAKRNGVLGAAHIILARLVLLHLSRNRLVQQMPPIQPDGFQVAIGVVDTAALGDELDQRRPALGCRLDLLNQFGRDRDLCAFALHERLGGFGQNLAHFEAGPVFLAGQLPAERCGARGSTLRQQFGNRPRLGQRHPAIGELGREPVNQLGPHIAPGQIVLFRSRHFVGHVGHDLFHLAVEIVGFALRHTTGLQPHIVL